MSSLLFLSAPADDAIRFNRGGLVILSVSAIDKVRSMILNHFRWPVTCLSLQRDGDERHSIIRHLITEGIIINLHRGIHSYMVIYIYMPLVI